MIRIISFNINGLRARPHQLEALKKKYDPDIIALQEIKVSDGYKIVKLIRKRKPRFGFNM